MSTTLLAETWVSLEEPGQLIPFAREGEYMYFVRVKGMRIDYSEMKVYVKLEVLKLNLSTNQVESSGEIEVEPGSSITFENYVVQVVDVYMG